MKKYISLLLILVLCLSSLPVRIFAEDASNYKVVTTALNLRAEPVSGTVVGALHYGDVIKVSEIRDGWVRTEFNGKQGWCSLRYLICLDTELLSVSEPGLDLIKGFEGFAKYAYWDYSQWTIGYGTRCEEGEYPDGITEAAAEELLRSAIVKYEEPLLAFLQYYKIEVTQNQFDALVSLTYNIGSSWTTSSTLASYLKEGIYNHSSEEITDAFCEYVHAGGEVVSGLVTRRKKEAEYFLSDEHFHSFKLQGEVKASCTEPGEGCYLCYCGESYTKVIPATGHKFSDLFVTVEPTKELPGLKISRCVVCSSDGETIQIPEIMPDINEKAWYFEGAKYCIIEGYITGNDKGLFLPSQALTREQFVVMLARVSGADVSAYKSSVFDDVKVGGWYAPYVAWAADKGYVKGVGDGSCFGVGQNITRQELCVMLFRYADSLKLDVGSDYDISLYTDYESIASWAQKEVAFAVSAGLMSSTDTGMPVFSPKMSVTRAQAAKIFMSFDNYKY